MLNFISFGSGSSGNCYLAGSDRTLVLVDAGIRLVKEGLTAFSNDMAETLKSIENDLKGQEARLAALNQLTDKKKPEEITQEEKDDKANTQKAIDEQKEKKEQLIGDYAVKNDIIHQLIDLALLQNGMLKGEALDRFLKRSVDLIK